MQSCHQTRSRKASSIILTKIIQNFAKQQILENSNFYIRQLLEQGTKLLASGGNEFEDDDSGDIDSKKNYASLTHDNMLFDLLLLQRREKEERRLHQPLHRQLQKTDKLGDLLGLKYIVAIRQDAVGEMLPTLLTVILLSLDDTIVDVRAVAADTLYSIVESVVNKTLIHKTLWNVLLDLDDLSVATSSVMQLLAKFYSLTGGSERMQNQGTQIFFSTELASLVPRLWPFFRHNLAAVRKSAVETLERLIGGPNCQSWILKILPETLRYVF